jgi:crotonobetainyl-CoA:carnitine CoA-transferase CaiB-like acyl-CoA transferase
VDRRFADEVGLFLRGPRFSTVGERARVEAHRQPLAVEARRAAQRVPCAGDDLVTVACYGQVEAFIKVAEHPEWGRDPRFTNLAARLAHQEALDALIAGWTRSRDPYQAMHALQAAGVPAGVCQTAGDRCDNDPQLKHLEWLTEVTGTKIGRWPVAEAPVKMSESPAYIGGRIDRGAPMYGEDNEYVFGELLGISTKEIAALTEEGVF